MEITNVQQTAQITTADTKDKKQLKAACQDMEAVFLNFLLRSMRKTVNKGELMGSGKDEETFRDMMDTEVCKSASKSSSTGLADVLYRQLSRDVERQKELATEETRGTNR